MAVSTLSFMAAALRRELQWLFGGAGFAVTIDTPSRAAEAHKTSAGLLNLFFYRIEPSGFDSGAGLRDHWFVRVRCLITAFSVEATGDDAASEGEMDLVRLGEVLRHFHENPALHLDFPAPVSSQPPEQEEEPSSEPAAAFPADLNVIFSPLSSEEINQIWSTQGDVPYRPSLLYEVALVPVLPRVGPEQAKLVKPDGPRVAVRASTDQAVRKALAKVFEEGAA